MSSEKDIATQLVTAASSSPEAVKVVGIIGTAANSLLWVADHANALVAVSTLIITWLMFYYTRKKIKAETRLAEINAELAERHKEDKQ